VDPEDPEADDGLVYEDGEIVTAALSTLCSALRPRGGSIAVLYWPELLTKPFLYFRLLFVMRVGTIYF
jgi:hypothetical protein